MQYMPLEQGLCTGRVYRDMAARPEEYFDDWFDMNIRWIRIEFEEYANENGVRFDECVAEYRKIIEEAHKRGIKVMGIVNQNAMPERKGFPDTDESIDIYVEAVEWHIQQYGIDAVEVLNEPGVFIGTRSCREKLARYARIMIETYTRLKPKYPDMIFVAPVSENELNATWLGNHIDQEDPNDVMKVVPESSIFNCTAMREYRSKNSDRLPLDVISWHPYGGDPWDKTKEWGFYYLKDFSTYFAQVMEYKDLDGRPIIGDYPIWFSEYGWHDGVFDEIKVRQYYERMLLEMKQRPQIEVAILYTYRDDEIEPDTEYNRHGIRRNSRNSFEMKDIYYSFFANNSGVGLLEDGTTCDAFVLAYKNNGGRKQLGCPVSAVNAVGSQGKVQIYQKGDSSSAAFQKNGVRFACIVKDPILCMLYNEAGRLDDTFISKYGWPVSDEYTDGDGKKVQDFEKGRMIIDNAQVAFQIAEGGLTAAVDTRVGIQGRVLIPQFAEKYESVSAEKMGKTVAEIEKLGKSGLIQHFTGGEYGDCAIITDNPRDRVYVCRGEIFRYYMEQKKLDSFGYPRSDVFRHNGAWYQEFQHGMLRYDGTGMQWIPVSGREERILAKY